MSYKSRLLHGLILILAASFALGVHVAAAQQGDHDDDSHNSGAFSQLSSFISAAFGLLMPQAPAASEASAVTDIYSDIPQSRTEDGAFVLGDPDAPITIIEFLDWGCPHCQAYKPT